MIEVRFSKTSGIKEVECSKAIYIDFHQFYRCWEISYRMSGRNKEILQDAIEKRKIPGTTDYRFPIYYHLIDEDDNNQLNFEFHEFWFDVHFIKKIGKQKVHFYLKTKNFTKVLMEMCRIRASIWPDVMEIQNYHIIETENYFLNAINRFNMFSKEHTCGDVTFRKLLENPAHWKWENEDERGNCSLDLTIGAALNRDWKEEMTTSTEYENELNGFLMEIYTDKGLYRKLTTKSVPDILASIQIARHDILDINPFKCYTDYFDDHKNTPITEILSEIQRMDCCYTPPFTGEYIKFKDEKYAFNYFKEKKTYLWRKSNGKIDDKVEVHITSIHIPSIDELLNEKYNGFTVKAKLDGTPIKEFETKHCHEILNYIAEVLTQDMGMKIFKTHFDDIRPPKELLNAINVWFDLDMISAQHHYDFVNNNQAYKFFAEPKNFTWQHSGNVLEVSIQSTAIDSTKHPLFNGFKVAIKTNGKETHNFTTDNAGKILRAIEQERFNAGILLFKSTLEDNPDFYSHIKMNDIVFAMQHYMSMGLLNKFPDSIVSSRSKECDVFVYFKNHGLITWKTTDGKVEVILEPVNMADVPKDPGTEPTKKEPEVKIEPLTIILRYHVRNGFRTQHGTMTFKNFKDLYEVILRMKYYAIYRKDFNERKMPDLKDEYKFLEYLYFQKDYRTECNLASGDCKNDPWKVLKDKCHIVWKRLLGSVEIEISTGLTPVPSENFNDFNLDKTNSENLNKALVIAFWIGLIITSIYAVIDANKGKLRKDYTKCIEYNKQQLNETAQNVGK